MLTMIRLVIIYDKISTQIVEVSIEANKWNKILLSLLALLFTYRLSSNLSNKLENTFLRSVERSEK